MRNMVLVVLMQVIVLPVWSQTTTLRGRLLDKDSGEGIALANVYADSLFMATVSDDQGYYELSGLPVGPIKLCVSHIAYQKYNEAILLSEKLAQHNIILQPTSTSLNPIVITGTGTSHRIDDAPVQTEIITRKDIAELSGKSIEEVLSSVSSSIDFVQSSMGSNLTINGLGSDYVLVLVDGKRMTGGIGGYADFSRLNTEDISQIEIVKGASSTLYGSDAIGGVINIITKKPKQKLHLKNNTRLDPYQWKQLNSIAYTRDKWSGKTTFNYKQQKGYQLNDMKLNNKWDQNHDLPYLVPTFYRPVNDSKAYTISQNLNYKLNSKLELNTDLSWYEKRLFLPFRAQMHNYYYNNRALSLGGKYQLSKTDVIHFSADYGQYLYYTEYPYKYNESYITPEGAVSVTYYPGEKFKNSDQTNLNLMLKGVFQLNKQHTLSTGIECMGEYLESQYRLSKNKVSAYTYAAYAQDEYKVNPYWSFVAGLRAIYHNKSGFMLTPKFTVMHKAQDFTYRLTYSNGFKSPTLKQLYYFYESDRMGKYRLYLGNEDLKPQQSHYISWSTEYKISSFSTGINLYLNKVNNKIDYKIIPTEYAYSRRGIEETKMRYNIAEARTMGIDWHLNIILYKYFLLSGGYSWVDARNLTQNVRLNGVAEHSITSKVAWTKKWQPYELNITLTGVYKSDRFYLEEDDKRSYAKPYQLFKLTTNHKLNTIKKCKLTAIAGVDNVFNYVDHSPYGSHYGTLSPGRNYFIGLNITFNKNN